MNITHNPYISQGKSANKCRFFYTVRALYGLTGPAIKKTT